jgi:hypothetical protein
MKEYIGWAFTLFLFTMFMYSVVMQSVVEAQDKGPYSTLKIREMWYVCAAKFKQVVPYMSQMERALLCDCYVDYTRKNYSVQEILDLSEKEAKKLGLQMRKQCPASIEFNLEKAI